MTRPVVALSAPLGPAHAPWLVLGPSLGTSAEALWHRAAAELAGHRLVMWDLPGHGRSPAAHGPFTVGEIADAVHGALRGIGVESFRYAGVSLGGAVGLELALRYPDDVAALVVIASAARLGTAPAWHERAALVRATSTSELVEGSTERWFAHGGSRVDPDVRRALLESLRQADDESYARCCEALADYDVRERLPSVTAPVLAVWGEHDLVTPFAAADEVSRGVANGRIARIGEAAHLPPAEQPRATAHEIDAFLGGIDSTSPRG
ncbi:alpha/beta hydrolase [Microbacterium sp. SSM24]|uniref:alpha/beta hydrolase n=1 Tax=Microbacterium sp. SSM24 TaxID=2991714 RepID=UPI0022276F91|nr:alpha/beta hydrolase [Microbacterium sp. SSM24]MCW3492651.1 alpha/beta hydrolase [Microbacterium sp. SSM24]